MSGPEPTGATPSAEGEDRVPGRRSDEVDVAPLHTTRSWWTWALLLLGPVTWATHFLVVYLVVEAWCATDPTTPTWLGFAAPVTVTLVATAAAAVVILGGVAFTALRYRQAVARTRHEHTGATDIEEQPVRDQQVLFIGLLLGPLSMVAVLAVGLPALWIQTC